MLGDIASLFSPLPFGGLSFWTRMFNWVFLLLGVFCMVVGTRPGAFPAELKCCHSAYLLLPQLFQISCCYSTWNFHLPRLDAAPLPFCFNSIIHACLEIFLLSHGVFCVNLLHVLELSLLCLAVVNMQIWFSLWGWCCLAWEFILQPSLPAAPLSNCRISVVATCMVVLLLSHGGFSLLIGLWAKLFCFPFYGFRRLAVCFPSSS